MNPFRRLFLPRDVRARHLKRALIFSQDDNASQPSRHLIELVLDASRAALDTELPEVAARMPAPPYWPKLWPGEHYRLLAALVRVIKPKRIVEIGTHTGLSALSLKQFLADGAAMVTFDVIPWRDIPDTALRDEDFADGRLRQIIADVGRRETLEAHRAEFEGAELMFVDGPKDGAFEPAFLGHLDALGLARSTIMIFDDILDRNMQGLWRSIPHPKLDITSLGHWTGTGIVHWGEPPVRAELM